MDALTITLEHELAGVRALVEIGRLADGSTGGGAPADAASLVAGITEPLFDDSLASKLTELGLPWAPSGRRAARPS